MLLAADLHDFLSCVTHFSIQLKGDAEQRASDELKSFTLRYDQHPLICAAASVVCIMGPLCGPLTHITVFGKVYLDEENVSCRSFLDAASVVCASSLTHLSLDLHGKHPNLPFGPAFSGDPDETLQFGCFFMLHSDACNALASFSCLTHLSIKYGWLEHTSLWASLPQSLQSLHIEGTNKTPPRQGWLLPHLRELTLQRSSCDWLKRILDACPQLLHLHLVELTFPTSGEDLTGLHQITNHVAWRPHDSGGSSYTPVTRFVQSYTPYLRGYPPDYLPSWKVLTSLPVMPTIRHFQFDIHHQWYDQDPMPVTADLMHHIPRAFPNLQTLHLAIDDCPEGYNSLLDVDLTGLYACSSLRELHIKDDSYVTGEALLLLAAALPKLVSMGHAGEKLVSRAHRAAICQLMQARRSQWSADSLSD